MRQFPEQDQMPEVSQRWYEMQMDRMVVPPEVVFRALAHETVLLNIRTGKYHGVDAIGARFFEMLRDAPNLKVAGERLAAEYEQPAERIREDLVTFVADMESRGLMRRESSLSVERT